MNSQSDWIQRRVQESWLHKMRREDDENLGKKCARVPLVKLPLKQRWTRYCQKIRKVTDLTSVFPDAALQVGDKRIDRTAAEFQKKKKAELTNAEYIELNVSTGSSFNRPLLRVPVSKDSGGPMHVGQGCVTHLTDTVNTSIHEKET